MKVYEGVFTNWEVKFISIHDPDGKVSPPQEYRYFINQDQADQIRYAIEKAKDGFGVSIQLIPVLAEEVEREPDRFADMVEITIGWRVE